MNVFVYGSATDKEMLMQQMKSQSHMAFRQIRYSQTDNYDNFLELLQTGECEMVFIMMDNAAGMEGVIAVQNLQPNTPIIWFSNDKNFVAQSYRLGVNYFAVKPINEKILKLALDRC